MSRVSACSRGRKGNLVTVITQDTPPLVKTHRHLFVPFSLVFTHHKLMGGRCRRRLHAFFHSFLVLIVVANLSLESAFFIRLCLSLFLSSATVT